MEIIQVTSRFATTTLRFRNIVAGLNSVIFLSKAVLGRGQYAINDLSVADIVPAVSIDTEEMQRKQSSYIFMLYPPPPCSYCVLICLYIRKESLSRQDWQDITTTAIPKPLWYIANICSSWDWESVKTYNHFLTQFGGKSVICLDFHISSIENVIYRPLWGTGAQIQIKPLEIHNKHLSNRCSFFRSKWAEVHFFWAPSQNPL